MSIIKEIARQFVYPSITKIGLEHVLSSFGENKKLILVYHGVVQQPRHQVSVGPISVKQLDEHFTYFKKHFDVVSQSEIFDMYRSDFQPKRKTLAITFDDGYENNYTHAFALLKKHSLPATMYVISSGITNENTITWYDYIDFIKEEITVGKLDVSSLGGTSLNSINQLKDLVKKLNIDKREVLYKEIARQVSIENHLPQFPREHWKLMSADQTKELADSRLVEIGSHSHTHPNLGMIEPEYARQEIVNSKKILEDTIQKEVKSIAFPDGDYTDDVKSMCVKAGYKNLLAADYRCVSDLHDKSILPRYCVSSTTTTNANMILIHKNFKKFAF